MSHRIKVELAEIDVQLRPLYIFRGKGGYIVDRVRVHFYPQDPGSKLGNLIQLIDLVGGVFE